MVPRGMTWFHWRYSSSGAGPCEGTARPWATGKLGGMEGAWQAGFPGCVRQWRPWGEAGRAEVRGAGLGRKP